MVRPGVQSNLPNSQFRDIPIAESSLEYLFHLTYLLILILVLIKGTIRCHTQDG